MKLAKGMISVTVLLSCYAPCLQDSIQPTSLRISANEKGSFKCSFNNSNKTIPTYIFWSFNGTFLDTFEVSSQEFVEESINENGLASITSTITILIDPKSVNVFNNTEIECHGIVVNEDSVILVNTLTAKLYVQGILSAPSGVHVHFLSTKMYAQWTHPTKPYPTDTIAYHINITYRSDYSPQGKVQTTNNSLCILYEVCVMEETLAGVGYPGCINTSSNISILGAFDIAVPSLSVLNHTNTTLSAVKIESTFICSPTEFSIHTDGEFHAANVSVRNSTNSLELELPALHNTVLESDAMTVELNLLQPGVNDLTDVLVENTESGVQVSCIYAQNSSAEGCLLVLKCVNNPDQECSTILIGKIRSNIFQSCNLPCATSSLYGYAYGHGIVAGIPSVSLESVKFDQDITLAKSMATTPSKTRVTTPSNSPTMTGSFYMTLIVVNCININLCMCCITCIAVALIKRRRLRRRQQQLKKERENDAALELQRYD